MRSACSSTSATGGTGAAISPDDDHWRFLVDLVDRAAEAWAEPDRGRWEWRGEPRHFVHSKVMCWAALDCGLRLAVSTLRVPRAWFRRRVIELADLGRWALWA
jgi:hypothetical protein